MAFIEEEPDMPVVKEEPPAEGLSHPAHNNGRRVAIIAAYWVVVLVAIPVWWYMTSIERLALPTGRIESIQSRRLNFPIHIEVDVEGSESRSAGLCEDLSNQFTRLKWEDREAWNSLDVRIYPLGARSEIDDVYRVRVKDYIGSLPPRIYDRALEVIAPPEDPMLPIHVAEILRDLLIPFSSSSIHSIRSESRIAQYAPRYRLAFTLLNEDASVGGAAMGWEVETAIERYITPTLKRMVGLHNFTLESQVQFFAPLTFEPSGPFTDANGAVEWRISKQELPVFINSAEWTLTSGVSNDPVLHFLVFIPSVERRPLYVHDDDFGVTSNAFIVPQWGGVAIHNPLTIENGSTPNSFLPIADLASPFALLRTQLHALLGVPQLPPGTEVHRNPNDVITGWQLDALKRRRAMENTRNSVDTLRSIVSLVKQIENMPVGEDVRSAMYGALDALDEIDPSITAPLSETLSHSIQALTLSSRAFFNPGMVGLLYFPAEHKYAVYTPLFAPMAVPLVVAILREIRAWRDRKRAVKQKAD